MTEIEDRDPVIEATLCGETACAEYRAELEAENAKLRAESATWGRLKCCRTREYRGHLYPCPFKAFKTIDGRQLCPEHARERRMVTGDIAAASR